MEIESLYGKWREKLLKLCLLMALLIPLVEIILFIWYEKEGSIDDIGRYLLLRMVIPNILDFSAFFLGYFIIHDDRTSSFVRNSVPVMLLIWFCGVVLFFHGIFAVLVSCFHLPVMLTVIYGSPFFTKLVSAVSFGIIAAGFFVSGWHGYYQLDNYISDYFICTALFLGVCLLANAMMYHEMDMKDILRRNVSERQALQEKLMRDPLTGLYTYDAFRNLMEERVLKEKKPVMVAVIYFDHKEVMAEYSILQDFSQLLRTKTGLHGFCSYNGKGAFAAAFPGGTKQHTQYVVDDIRRALQKYPEVMNAKFPQVSFTACISQYDMEKGETVEDFLLRLDESVVKAQGIGGGRNIVV